MLKMEYKINKKNFRIELKGSEEEIKKFARCLVEIVDKNSISEFESFEFEGNLKQFELNAYQIIYLDKNSIIYMPKVGGNSAIKKIHFKFMEENYLQAKKNFLK